MTNDQIEKELREALCRVPAPDAFTDKVLARLDQDDAGRGWHWWYVAAAAILIMALALGMVHRSHEVREQQAKRTETQVIYALSLAADKLQKVNVRLAQSAPELKLQKKQEKHYE